MSAAAIIMNALKQFDPPCSPDLYTGEKDHYFTYNYADDTGADYGDNEPGCTIAYMQVHYFLPLGEDYQEEKNRIREALFEAGFSYPDVTILTEQEENITHIVFECNIAEEREGKLKWQKKV